MRRAAPHRGDGTRSRAAEPQAGVGPPIVEEAPMSWLITIVLLVAVAALVAWAAVRQRSHPGQTGVDGSEHGSRHSPWNQGSGGAM